METTYHLFEGKIRKLLFALYGTIFILYLIAGIIGHEGQQPLLTNLPLLLPFILPTLFMFLRSVRINDTERFLDTPFALGRRLNGPRTPIDSITAIEVFRSKRSRKITRLLVRSGPTRFFRIAVTKNEEVLAHLLRLNPAILTEEKPASFGNL